MANIADKVNVRSNGSNGNNEGDRNSAVRKTVKAKTVQNTTENAIKASPKASATFFTKEIVTTDENVQAIVTKSILNITPETTLNELISLARNNAVEKPKVKPKFITLRQNYRCVASLKGEFFNLFVYDNGYAGYEAYGKTAAIDLDDIFTVNYPSSHYDASFDADSIKNSPWTYALITLGDERIDIQRNKDKAFDYVFENDDDYYCESDCGIKKLGKPALTAHIDDPETAYIKKESQREFNWALSKTRADMTEKQAEAFRLYYDEDMTQEEVGKILGISHQAVSCRIGGAEQKLRKNMEHFL